MTGEHSPQVQLCVCVCVVGDASCRLKLFQNKGKVLRKCRQVFVFRWILGQGDADEVGVAVDVMGEDAEAQVSAAKLMSFPFPYPTRRAPSGNPPQERYISVTFLSHLPRLPPRQFLPPLPLPRPRAAPFHPGRRADASEWRVGHSLPPAIRESQ